MHVATKVRMILRRFVNVNMDDYYYRISAAFDIIYGITQSQHCNINNNDNDDNVIY